MTPIEQMKASAAKSNRTVLEHWGEDEKWSKPSLLPKIEARRKEALNLLRQGMNQSQIATLLKVDRGTIIRDLKAIEAEQTND